MSTESTTSTSQDCMPCKITGGLAFSGTGIYLLWERSRLSKHLTSRRYGLAIAGSSKLSNEYLLL
jgi:hypothetical protein